MEEKKVAVVEDEASALLELARQSMPNIKVVLPPKSNRLKCVLCSRPLGLPGSSPAITVELRHKVTNEKAKGLAHRSCVRQRVGLR